MSVLKAAARARRIIALEHAAGLLRHTALEIERELSRFGEDGAPDAPPIRTRAGLVRDDAVEWRMDAMYLDHLRKELEDTP